MCMLLLLCNTYINVALNLKPRSNLIQPIKSKSQKQNKMRQCTAMYACIMCLLRFFSIYCKFAEYKNYLLRRGYKHLLSGCSRSRVKYNTSDLIKYDGRVREEGDLIS